MSDGTEATINRKTMGRKIGRITVLTSELRLLISDRENLVSIK
jgi:hypothetical protein